MRSISSMRLKRRWGVVWLEEWKILLWMVSLRTPITLSRNVAEWSSALFSCFFEYLFEVFFFMSSFDSGSRRNMKPSWVQLGTKVVQLGGVWGLNFGPSCAKLDSSWGQMAPRCDFSEVLWHFFILFNMVMGFWKDFPTGFLIIFWSPGTLKMVLPC